MRTRKKQEYITKQREMLQNEVSFEKYLKNKRIYNVPVQVAEVKQNLNSGRA